MAHVNPQDPINDLTAVIAALNHRHRREIVRALLGGRKYVSALARELQMSRPLLYLHLEKLEAAELVRGATGADEAGTGRNVRWYELVPFDVHLTPRTVSEAAEPPVDRDG